MRFTYSFFLFVVLLSCVDEGEVPQEIKYATLQIVSGDNQSGTTGRFLENDIVLKVTPLWPAFKPERFFLQPEFTKGNGDITRAASGYPTEIINTDLTGTFKASWQLGCDLKNQEVTFYLYYTDSCNSSTPRPCKFIDFVTVKAVASTPAGWNRSCGIAEAWGTDLYNSRIRTYNNEMYALNHGTLCKAEMGEGLSWKKIPGVPANDIFDFGFTTTGTIYILTENHGVYASDNLQQWTSESTGILDPRYPHALLVEDSVVYISFYFDGLYRLRPSKSNFWKKLLIDGRYYEEYKFMTRHPNGNLYLVDKWDAYWVSENSGDTWTHIPIDYKYVNYETEDLKIHSSGMIYIGSGDASLAILSPETYTGTLHRYYEWNASHQTINNIIFRNTNDVYYLVNSTPNPGIFSSVNDWQEIDIGFDKPINQFVFDPSGHFLVGTYDGLYYWKD